MYSTQAQSSAVKVGSGYHLSAAAYHEDAAYDDGNYHQAIRQAKLEKSATNWSCKIAAWR